jgi:hypothetical protein
MSMHFSRARRRLWMASVTSLCIAMFSTNISDCGEKPRLAGCQPYGGVLASLEGSLEEGIKRIPAADKIGGKKRSQLEEELLHSLVKDAIGKGGVTTKEFIEEVLANEDRGFANLTLCKLIQVLAEAGDRNSLRMLLARRCPDRVTLHTSLEAALIVVHRKTLTDGALVLCDAFDDSTQDDVRQRIAKALRRAFSFAKLDSANDKQFISDCRKWYLKNRAAYVPNLRYCEQFTVDEFPYSVEGVLISKDADEARKRQQKPSRPPPSPD